MSLPSDAAAAVERIEALLDEAERFDLATQGGDDAYALRETRARYLPETLAAFEGIPPMARSVPDDVTGATPEQSLLSQLDVLERATAQRLQRLADGTRLALSANGRFLIERFGSAESLPAAPAPASVNASGDAPALTASRFIASIGANAQNKQIVDAIATRFQSAFPSIVQVERGLFGGPAKSVAIVVPRGDERLRYAIAIDRTGSIEASCSKIVRGVTIRTISAPLDEWVRALFEDLHQYARASEHTRTMLASLLR